MAIEFTKGAPKGVENNLGDWLPEIERVSAVGGTKGQVAASLSEAYQVNYLSVSEIKDGKLLPSEAKCRDAWRHLVMVGGHAVAELELGNGPVPVALHEGVAKDGLLAAIDKASQLNEDYTATVLQCSAIRFSALWLHRDAEDLIMPFPPNTTSLADYRAVSVADAKSVLQPMAISVEQASGGGLPTAG